MPSPRYTSPENFSKIAKEKQKKILGRVGCLKAQTTFFFILPKMCFTFRISFHVSMSKDEDNDNETTYALITMHC
jgi:hypothetical protein